MALLASRSVALGLGFGLMSTLGSGALVACERSRPSEPAPSGAAAASPSAPSVAAPKPLAGAGATASTHPAPARLVAIGDLHGDLEATRKVLRLAGAIDASDAWVGGKLVVVQTGDAIDRGDDDRAILDLFERLKLDAAKAGGEVVAMSGNHEIMNAQLDFRYVTAPAFATFVGVPPRGDGAASAQLAKLEPEQRGRGAAFVPAGPYAAMLARRPVIVRFGDSVFVHGGVLPKHVRYGIDRLNSEARAWLSGESASLPRELVSEDGPIWTHFYSAAPGREECATLEETLGMLGAKRMVMGHTVQRNGVNAACEGKAWRIDVGLSKFYGGPIQALAIEGDAVKVLKEP